MSNLYDPKGTGGTIMNKNNALTVERDPRTIMFDLISEIDKISEIIFNKVFENEYTLEERQISDFFYTKVMLQFALEGKWSFAEAHISKSDFELERFDREYNKNPSRWSCIQDNLERMTMYMNELKAKTF